jgi:hypothetical protein
MSGSSSAGAPASAPGGSTSSAASKPISASGPLSRSKEPGGIKLGEKELDLLRTLRNQGVMARSGRWDRGDEPDPGTGCNAKGCFVPHLTPVFPDCQQSLRGRDFIM